MGKVVTHMAPRFLRVIFVIFAVAFLPRSAAASPDVRKSANLLVMAEAILEQSSFINSQFEKKFDTLKWSAKFSDRGWIVEVSGEINGIDSEYTLRGFAWGDDSQPIAITFSGDGDVGGEPFYNSGQATWPISPDYNDYVSMDFQQVSRIGAGSIWNWMYGAEAVVGAVAGGVIAGGVTITASGGLALGASPAAAAWGALEGAAVLGTLSGVAEKVFESDTPPEPPQSPARPSLPQDTNELKRGDGQIIIAMDSSGTIQGVSSDGAHEIDGMYYWNDGAAEGSISVRRN